MKLHELSTLVQWLKDNCIESIEVQAPGSSVRIVMPRDARSTSNIGVATRAAPSPPPIRKSSIVIASATGIFLSAHPLRTAPLAAAGSTVDAGDVLGLLKVSEVLYRPVLAGRKGSLVRALAQAGDLIEDGMPLFEIDIGRAGELTSLGKRK